MKNSLIILIFSLFVQSTIQFGCKANGKFVPYWVALKLPGKVDDNKKSFLFHSDSSEEFEFTEGLSIDATKSPLGQSFSQATKTRGILAWNDEKPDGSTTTTGAHSKGAIIYDSRSKTAIYILHSVPKYPEIDSNKIELTIPDGENIYGQSFICLTLEADEIDKIAAGLRSTKINIYYNSLKGDKLPENLKRLADNDVYEKSENYFSAVVNTKSGPAFHTFFKNYKYEVEPYQEFLSSYLKEDIVVESWGRPYSPSNCATKSGYSVKNVNEIEFSSSISWNSTNDHSKWCISKTFACVNGMNNMESQIQRGGSFLCAQIPGLVSAFSKIISSEEECSAKSFLSLN